MKDYEQLLSESQKNLENARIQKARLEEQISTLVKDLDLDPSKSLVEQCEDLKKSLDEKMESLDSEIEELQKELEKYEEHPES